MIGRMHRGAIPVLPTLCLRGWEIVILRPFRQQQIALPLTVKPHSPCQILLNFGASKVHQSPASKKAPDISHLQSIRWNNC